MNTYIYNIYICNICIYINICICIYIYMRSAKRMACRAMVPCTPSIPHAASGLGRKVDYRPLEPCGGVGAVHPPRSSRRPRLRWGLFGASAAVVCIWRCIGSGRSRIAPRRRLGPCQQPCVLDLASLVLCWLSCGVGAIFDGC